MKEKISEVQKDFFTYIIANGTATPGYSNSSWIVLRTLSL